MFIEIFMSLQADCEDKGINNIEVIVDDKSFNLIGEQMMGMLFYGSGADVYKTGEGHYCGISNVVTLENINNIDRMHTAFIIINRKIKKSI